MIATALAWCVALLIAAPGSAQTIAVEGAHAAGATTEAITAAGTQLRVLGEVARDLR